MYSIVEEGYRVLYDREVCLEVRTPEHQEESGRVGSADAATNDDGAYHVIGNLESMVVRLLQKGSDESPDTIRVELSNESDLLFNLIHEITPEKFAMIKAKQSFNVEFPEYASMLISMLNKARSESEEHIAVLYLRAKASGLADNPAGSVASADTSAAGGGGGVQASALGAELVFYKNLDYKTIELLNVRLTRDSEENIQKQILFRYNCVKTRLALAESKLREVHNLVKKEHPSLALEIQRI